MAIKLIIISIVVQLVSSKPIIIDTSSDNSTATNSGTNTTVVTTPIALLVTCRAGTYIKRDCKFYIDCYKGYWRRNFCPETKAWNHDLKMCDDLQNVPECMALYLDMKHSPINGPEKSNHFIDEEKSGSDKRKPLPKKPKNRLKQGEEEMVIEENRFSDNKKTNKSSGDKSEPKVNKDIKQKPNKNSVQTEDNVTKDNQTSNPLPMAVNCSNGYTLRIEFKIDESVYKLFRNCFYYISLLIAFIKS